MVICIGNHALHLLRDSAPHANSASAE
jgi:hypothetical protein